MPLDWEDTIPAEITGCAMVAVSFPAALPTAWPGSQIWTFLASGTKSETQKWVNLLQHRTLLPAVKSVTGFPSRIQHTELEWFYNTHSESLFFLVIFCPSYSVYFTTVQWCKKSLSVNIWNKHSRFTGNWKSPIPAEPGRNPQ